ncbi:MAG: alpha/beta hydrolase, partial [Chloroflexota bacterium]
VFADLRGLPPLLIHAGEDEVLRDDSIRMAELAREAGVSVRLEVYPRMWHVWHLYHATLPQASHALEDIAEFLKLNVGSLASQPN